MAVLLVGGTWRGFSSLWVGSGVRRGRLGWVGGWPSCSRVTIPSFMSMAGLTPGARRVKA